jgi:hypothetical protein
MGETRSQPFQLSFNRSLKVDFQDSRVTFDSGLPLVRELDERLGLSALITENIMDDRRGKENAGPAPKFVSSQCLLASIRKGLHRTLCHFFFVALVWLTVAGCSNKFDKQYDGAMTTARMSFQNRDFGRAAETYLEAAQIRGGFRTDDWPHREEALKGFFRSCYYINPAERVGPLSKMKASLSSATPDEQESFLFFRTGAAEIDSSVVAEVRSATAEVLRKRPQADWEAALALELRISGVAVKKIEDARTTLLVDGGEDREFRSIRLFGKLDPKAERDKIERTVKAFLVDHPGIVHHDLVDYFDDEQESGTLIKQRGALVKICDL